MDHLIKFKERLLKITEGCRPDMHEPDEQGLSARVVGTQLDNAMGDRIRENMVELGAQEIIVILDNGDQVERFNLATLISLARLGDTNNMNPNAKIEDVLRLFQEARNKIYEDTVKLGLFINKGDLEAAELGAENTVYEYDKILKAFK